MKAEKRRTPPMQVKLQGALNQLEHAMRKLGQVPVEETIEAWEFDHDPPLELRAVDEATGEHRPHQHDVRFLVWRPKKAHRAKTTGRKGESKLSIGDGDAQKIGKVRRRDKRRAAEAAQREAAEFSELPIAELSELRSTKNRPTEKKRKFQSRGFKPPKRQCRASGYRRRGV